eukprot:3920332-Pyramimonas_sp.AAC.1
MAARSPPLVKAMSFFLVTGDPADNELDSWEVIGSVFRRHHDRPRRAMFTPCRVSGAPVEVERLGPVRMANCIYVDHRDVEQQQEF